MKDTAELVAGLGHILAAPKDHGRLELIVRRPRTGEREELNTGNLTPDDGLVGDGWRRRVGNAAAPDTQITLMNSRVATLLAGEIGRWAEAGDQLFVDLDLSEANVPPGTRLEIGTAVLEVVAQPHTGCRKFVERFGLDAMNFVNSAEGRALHLRGIYAKVITAGAVTRHDRIDLRRPSTTT